MAANASTVTSTASMVNMAAVTAITMRMESTANTADITTHMGNTARTEIGIGRHRFGGAFLCAIT